MSECVRLVMREGIGESRESKEGYVGDRKYVIFLWFDQVELHSNLAWHVISLLILSSY